MFNQNHDINKSFIKDEDIDLDFDKLESKKQSKDNFDQVQRISSFQKISKDQQILTIYK